MKDNYFDNPNTDEERIQRNKKKKKGTFGKTLLMIIGMLVIALAAFVITIKLISPDFDLVSLVPEKVMSVVSFNQTTEPAQTTTETTTVTTTQPTTTAELLSYLPIEDFKTEESKKGNQLGNILNGGLAGTDMTFIYHIVNGDGIYRSTDKGKTWSRINDESHLFGNITPVITGDSEVFGRVYFATNGRGIVMGDPAAK